LTAVIARMWRSTSESTCADSGIGRKGDTLQFVLLPLTGTGRRKTQRTLFWVSAPGLSWTLVETQSTIQSIDPLVASSLLGRSKHCASTSYPTRPSGRHCDLASACAHQTYWPAWKIFLMIGCEHAAHSTPRSSTLSFGATLQQLTL